MNNDQLKINGISMKLSKSGIWETEMNKAHEYLPLVRMKQPKYRDVPELKSLADLEQTYKQQYRKVLRITVLQIVKFLDNI